MGLRKILKRDEWIPNNSDGSGSGCFLGALSFVVGFLGFGYILADWIVSS
jgi:hypothetical protein